MRRHKRWISDWAHDLMRQADLADYGYSDVNVVERLLRDPGRAPRAESKILFWHRNPRIAAVSRASRVLSNLEQTILLVHYKAVRNEDGSVMTKRQLARILGMDLRKINGLRSYSEKTLLNKITG